MRHETSKGIHTCSREWCRQTLDLAMVDHVYCTLCSQKREVEEATQATFVYSPKRASKRKLKLEMVDDHHATLRLYTARGHMSLNNLAICCS